MRAHRPRRRTPRPDDASVLVIVLVTLMFTAAALVAFMDKARNDLAVETRPYIADRLRREAYSAVEVTLATLVDFSMADSGLHSTSEGWSDPLAWAGWSPEPGHKVEVTFEDESGKIPLIHADAATLNNLFQYWKMTQNDAQHLTDVLLSWMQQNYIPTNAFNATYAQSDLPFAPPLRAIRSFEELRAIDYAREVFFDKEGRPNDLWWRFQKDCSIFSFTHPDINGANADVLAAVGGFSDDQQQNLASYLSGTGNYSSLGQQWFQNTTSVRGVVGSTGNSAAFGTVISALRINVTVHEGSNSVFRLSVVVAPQGGAKTVQTTATDMKTGASNSGTGETGSAVSATGQSQSVTQSSASPTSAQTAAAAAVNLQYPFTILQVLENDEIPVEPPAPPAKA
jgi:Type II secretion system (T2SS), protein K